MHIVFLNSHRAYPTDPSTNWRTRQKIGDSFNFWNAGSHQIGKQT